MERFIKVIILLMIATIPAAAPRDFAAVPNLCFNTGSTTFQLSPSASAPDYRVKFVGAETYPDMRVQLVDEVTNAAMRGGLGRKLICVERAVKNRNLLHRVINRLRTNSRFQQRSV